MFPIVNSKHSWKCCNQCRLKSKPVVFCNNQNEIPSPEIIESGKKRRSRRQWKYSDQGVGQDIIRDATTTQRGTPSPNLVIDAEFRDKKDIQEEQVPTQEPSQEVLELEKQLGVDEQDKQLFRDVFNMNEEQVEFMDALSPQDIDLLHDQLQDEQVLERRQEVLLQLLLAGPKIEKRIEQYNQKGEIDAALLAVLFKRIQASELMQEEQEVFEALVGLFRRLRAVFERNRASVALRLLDDLLNICDENQSDPLATNEALKSRMQAAFSGQQSSLGIFEIAQQLSQQLPEDRVAQEDLEELFPQTEFVPKELFVQEVEQLIKEANSGKETMEQQYAQIVQEVKLFDEMAKTEGFEITEEERIARQSLKTAQRDLKIQLDFKKEALLQVQQILALAQQI